MNYCKIRKSFECLQKVAALALCVLMAGIFFACTEKLENDTTQAILGKWELVAEGAYENHINERTDGFCWEFSPDGTLRVYYLDTHAGIIHGDNTIEFSYKIESDLLYIEENIHKQYRYEFNFKKDQLKLTREPIFIPYMIEIGVANFLFFKKIK